MFKTSITLGKYLIDWSNDKMIINNINGASNGSNIERIIITEQSDLTIYTPSYLEEHYFNQGRDVEFVIDGSDSQLGVNIDMVFRRVEKFDAGSSNNIYIFSCNTYDMVSALVGGNNVAIQYLCVSLSPNPSTGFAGGLVIPDHIPAEFNLSLEYRLQDKLAFNTAYNELTNKAATMADIPAVPTALSELSEDSTHRTVTDTEKNTWNNKQDALVFDATPSASNKVVTQNNPVIQAGTNPDTEPTDNSTKFVTSGGVKTYVDKTNYHRNLLHNPYFKIDQRGGYLCPPNTPYYDDQWTQIGTTSEYLTVTISGSQFYVNINNTLYQIHNEVAVRGYKSYANMTADRWWISSQDTACFIGDGEVTLEKLSLGSDDRKLTYSESFPYNDLPHGVSLTASFIRDGNLIEATFTLPTNEPTQRTAFVYNDDFEIYWYSGALRIGFLKKITSIGDRTIISGTKLEGGEGSTLLEEKAQSAYDYIDDLEKCRMFFKRLKSQRGLGNGSYAPIAYLWAYSATDALFSIPTTPMRAVPQVTISTGIDGYNDIIFGGNGQRLDRPVLSRITGGYSTSDCVAGDLTVVGNFFTPNQMYAMSLAGNIPTAYVDISADIV